MSSVTEKNDSLDRLIAECGRILSESPGRAREEALYLVSGVLSISRAEALAKRDGMRVSPRLYRRAVDAARRRRDGVSLAALLGRKEFYGREFVVNADVLIPRPLSETVVDLAKKHAADAKTVLDLGTGSGNLLITLTDELSSAVFGVGIDVDVKALRVAAANLERRRPPATVRLVAADWLSALSADAEFDLIVSNPPYVADGLLAALEPDDPLRHEPRIALDGGPDGLDQYRKMLPALPNALGRNSILIVEFGPGQLSEITLMFGERGLERIDHDPESGRLAVFAPGAIYAGRGIGGQAK